jgi:acyl-coenzyme A thioesterase PaaI-like protein
VPHTQPHEHFAHEPAPEFPGWWTWDLKEPGYFNDSLGPLFVRLDDNGRALVRMVPGKPQGNLRDVVHGGALLGFIDIALFAGARLLGEEMIGNAVTVDLQTQFIGAGYLDVALDADVQVLRSTRRLVFLRGTITQHDGAHLVASFSGIIRKPSAPSVDAA